MRIHSFEHVSFEGLGNIEKWCEKNGHDIKRTLFYNPFKMPDVNDFDWLVIMGGPMSVYEQDQYPWLKEELQFISHCIQKGKKVLGICLGSQLIASALGAKVYPNKEKEIGWFPVNFNPEVKDMPWFHDFQDEMTVFHWHGDTFDLPDGAVRVASSKPCRNQGFIYQNHVLALQFHLEVDSYLIEDLISNGQHEFLDAPYIQSPEIIRKNAHYGQNLQEKLFQLLNSFEN